MNSGTRSGKRESDRPLAMLVVGARPNFVKMAPLVRAMEKDGRLQPFLVHTGQHYDNSMSGVFFTELGLPTPNVNLGVGSGSHAIQTGAIMAELEKLVRDIKPSLMVSVGDVNSTLATAIVAAKATVPQAHVEAGLRSRDPEMPEEINRVVADRLADILFTHSEEANVNLRNEGVAAERIRFVGNVMIDTLLHLRPRWQGAARASVPQLPSDYGVVTLHRPSNVDEDAGLDRLMAALMAIAEDLPLIFPVHPRTAPRLGGDTGRVRLIEPVGYLGFLDLLEHSRLVLTDSGGIQEETTVLGVPCLTLRENTERPITVRLGTNTLVGTDPARIVAAARSALAAESRKGAELPLWDGHAAERMVPILVDWISDGIDMRLQE